MARRFRVFQKKRGNRRSGSQELGRFGEVAFFVAVFLLGCVGLVVVFFSLAVPQWKANLQFVAHPCRILDARLGHESADSATLFRPDVQIEYQVDGQTYRNWTYDLRREYSTDKAGAEAVVRRFRSLAGQEYDCWYDPADPKVAVLVRGSAWWAWMTLIVPVSFLLIGGGGLGYYLFGWGKSVERRADLARRAGSLDPFENHERSWAGFPTVPAATNIIDSPGTRLAFRLPAASSAVWKLLLTLAAGLVWNAIVAVFAVGAVRGHVRGEPDWFLTLFIVPFLLVGIGFVVYLVGQLLLWMRVGPTLVEISEQPLVPGNDCRLYLSQRGRLRLRSLEVSLVCDEVATFRHGTNTRTETRRVYTQSLLSCRALEIQNADAFEDECHIKLPAGAMHSFKSEHNEVNWRLLVRGRAAGRRRFVRSFPLLVHPPRNGKPTP